MKALRGPLLFPAFFAGLVLVGCGVAPNLDEEKPVIVERTGHLFQLQCRESAQFLAVDPGRARAHVPAGYTVFVSGQPAVDISRALPDGKAIFLMIYQECSTATWDGVELAPLDMVHHWVRIEGPIVPRKRGESASATGFSMSDARTTAGAPLCGRWTRASSFLSVPAVRLR